MLQRRQRSRRPCPRSRRASKDYNPNLPERDELTALPAALRLVVGCTNCTNCTNYRCGSYEVGAQTLDRFRRTVSFTDQSPETRTGCRSRCRGSRPALWTKGRPIRSLQDSPTLIEPPLWGITRMQPPDAKVPREKNQTSLLRG